MLHISRKLLALVGILALGLATHAGAYPVHAAAAREPLCFSQTGLCINGRFRDYWAQNGGLPLFGLPLTPTSMDLNSDTGQRYMTQWYERNRFELHPDKAAPYDVLLGRLGAERLRQLGRSWQTEPRAAGPRGGCLWFAQTGHNVCDIATADVGPQTGFKSYWLAEGLADPSLSSYERSLALHGLPLTEPQMETNASGDTVLTQWFERDRFEWHPKNPAGFKVQLGLLGSELRPTEASMVQVAADFKRQAPGVRPVLVPGFLAAGMVGRVLVSNGQAYGVEYHDAKAGKTIQLLIEVANPPLPGATTDQKNPAFRKGTAFYQVRDRTDPTSARLLMWDEPGEWRTTNEVVAHVPYYLTSDGVTETEFWQVANSLYAVGE